ncbi:HK97 family phage prohead protease [Limibacter armeniacum]|uniref:HK97 family phage prohead protease n=1 Tax=Limibacter armeniacum TaxID=466084 RepID=UPI002FE5FBB8
MKIENAEYRSIEAAVSVELKEESKHIVGRGITFNEWSNVMYDKESVGNHLFREMILPEAVSDELLRGDIKSFAYHERSGSHLLGRTSSGTMTVSKRQDGVYYAVQTPETNIGRDAYAQAERGDLKGSSFIFLTDYKDRNKVEIDYSKTPVEVKIRKIDRIISMDPVVDPAYSRSEVSARSISVIEQYSQELKRKDDYIKKLEEYKTI